MEKERGGVLTKGEISWLNVVFTLYVNAAHAAAVEAAAVEAATAAGSSGGDVAAASSSTQSPRVPDILTKSQFVEAVERINLTDEPPSQADLGESWWTLAVTNPR